MVSCRRLRWAGLRRLISTSTTATRAPTTARAPPRRAATLAPLIAPHGLNLYAPRLRVLTVAYQASRLLPAFPRRPPRRVSVLPVRHRFPGTPVRMLLGAM